MSRQNIQCWGTTQNNVHHTMQVSDSGGLVFAYNNSPVNQTLMDTVAIGAGASVASSLLDMGTSFVVNSPVYTFWDVQGVPNLKVDLTRSIDGVNFYSEKEGTPIGTSILNSRQLLLYDNPGRYCKWDVYNYDASGVSVSLNTSYFKSV